MTAINFEEELQIEENPWRGRIITLLVLLGLGAVIAAAIWYFFFRDESLAVSRQTEEIPVARGTINQNLTITGTADAQLNSDLVFQTSGKVDAVNVKVGDVVQQGQVLASLESDDLANSVESAQATLRTSQLKLDDLLAGSTPAEFAAAQQTVASALAQYTKAQNDYDTLRLGWHRLRPRNSRARRRRRPGAARDGTRQPPTTRRWRRPTQTSPQRTRGSLRRFPRRPPHRTARAARRTP